jgi:hypothetical protein
VDFSAGPDVISGSHKNHEIAGVLLNQGARLSLKSLHEASTSRGRFSLEEDVYVLLDADPKVDFESLDDLMMKMRDFLTMCTLEVCVPIRLTGVVNRDAKPGDQDFGQLDIYYKLIDYPANSRTPHWSEMVVPYKDIKDRFENVVRRWYDGYEKMSPFFDSFFSTHYVPVMYTQQKFLSRINAIELYHRINYRNYVIDQTLHKERLKRILDSSPDTYKEWLANQLNWSNEPQLRFRLEEVVSELGRPIEHLLGYSKNGIGRIVTTRNYFTHRDPELEDKAAKDLELIYLTRVLDVMIRMLMLKEIGFDTDEIEERICDTWLYRGLIDWRKQLAEKSERTS